MTLSCNGITESVVEQCSLEWLGGLGYEVLSGSTRTLPVSSPRPATQERGEGQGEGFVKSFPALLTYFRQGKLDKFFLGASGSQPTAELDFMSAAKILKPADNKETRQSKERNDL